MNSYPFDQDYLRRLRENDPETISHFFAHFSRLLQDKLRIRKLPDMAIDDITQETFVRVLRTVHTGKFHDAASMGAYVNLICNQVTIEYYRKRQSPLQN